MKEKTDLVQIKAFAKELCIHRNTLVNFIENHCPLIEINDHIFSNKGNVPRLSKAVTKEESIFIKNKREEMGFSGSTKIAYKNKTYGCFYIVQPFPDIVPNRIKLGFSDDIKQRMATYRTLAPECILLKSWECKRQWEKALIELITTKECKPLTSELFEVKDIEKTLESAENIFLTLEK